MQRTLSCAHESNTKREPAPTSLAAVWIGMTQPPRATLDLPEGNGTRRRHRQEPDSMDLEIRLGGHIVLRRRDGRRHEREGAGRQRALPGRIRLRRRGQDRASRPCRSGRGLQYFLDNFATVAEAVQAMQDCPFTVVAPVLPTGGPQSAPFAVRPFRRLRHPGVPRRGTRDPSRARMLGDDQFPCL